MRSSASLAVWPQGFLGRAARSPASRSVRQISPSGRSVDSVQSRAFHWKARHFHCSCPITIVAFHIAFDTYIHTPTTMASRQAASIISRSAARSSGAKLAQRSFSSAVQKTARPAARQAQAALRAAVGVSGWRGHTLVSTALLSLSCPSVTATISRRQDPRLCRNQGNRL